MVFIRNTCISDKDIFETSFENISCVVKMLVLIHTFSRIESSEEFEKGKLVIPVASVGLGRGVHG